MKLSQTLLYISLTLALFCPLSAQQKKKGDKPLPANVELIEGIEYAKPNGYSLQLDVYRPKDTKVQVPAIVFVHGGGWKNGNRKSGKQGVWLVEHGFAIVSITYRLTDKGQWPDQINDCYEAVRWVRRNADKYGFDKEKVGCWGMSAGGHLVALMGTRTYPGKEDISSRVQAVCDWFGPSELLSMPPNNVGNGRTEVDIAKSNGAKLLGATVRDVPELAKDASALDNVSKDDAAFLILHGDADKGVPLIQSQKLHEKLQAHEVPSQLVVLNGAGHGGAQFSSESSRKTMLEFFTKYLK
jgi:acetyl esterase/lipase